MTIQIAQPNLVDQLKLAVDEEHWFLDAQHKREAFYSSIITAVIAATIAGALKADGPYPKLVLLFGPFMILTLTDLARGATQRFYRRYLEAVTIRAKLEQALGLTRSSTVVQDRDHWKGEPIVPTRHLRVRRESTTSETFCKLKKSVGYQKSTTTLFSTYENAAWGPATLLALSALWDTSS